jgi:hypothetical protein
LAPRPHDIGAPADHPDRKSLSSNPQWQTDEFTLPSRNLLRADYRRKAGFVPSPSFGESRSSMELTSMELK